MAGLTLVPLPLARQGARFTFLGANPGDECDGCPVRRLCFDLEPGTAYEVTEVRDVEHPCNLHDEGKVRVVKAAPAAVETSAEARHLRGTALTWDAIDCGYPECAHWKLCHPMGAARNVRYAIVEETGAVACPMNYDIRRVTLRRD